VTEDGAAARARPGAPALRIEHLYFILALSMLGFFSAVNPIIPHDFWWHIAAGRVIFEQGRIPDTISSAWTIPSDTPYVYGTWLSELLLYLLYRAGDTALVTFTRNVLAMTAYALIGLEGLRRTSSWRWAALTMVLAGLLGLNNLLVRPQIWAWVPFVLFLVLLWRHSNGVLASRWLLLLPVVMVFWTNVHGSFTLGLAILAAFGVGEMIDRLRRTDNARSWKEIGWIGLVGIACLLATLANPRGPGIFGYVRTLLTDVPTQVYGVEWQPTTPGGVVNTVFYLSILALLAAFAVTRRPPRTSHLLLALGFLWLAWSGQRYVVWYGMAMAPLLIESLAGIFARRSQTRSEAGSPLVNLVAAGALLLPTVLAQPWLVNALPLPPSYTSAWHAPPASPLISTMTPLGAAEYLRMHPGGRLFNDLGYGSYLIWTLPEEKLFIDPRFEAFPVRLVEDYLEITAGRRWAEHFQQYGVDRVLLSREAQPRLAAGLAQASDWRLEYRDALSELWTRSSAPGPRTP
jgi:hypothetical protein